MWNKKYPKHLILSNHLKACKEKQFAEYTGNLMELLVKQLIASKINFGASFYNFTHQSKFKRKILFKPVFISTVGHASVAVVKANYLTNLHHN